MSMQPHSAPDEIWLRALVIALDQHQQTKFQTLADCIPFVSEQDQRTLARYWARKEKTLKSLKHYVGTNPGSKPILLPQYTPEISKLYEVIFSYSIQVPNIFETVSKVFNGAKRCKLGDKGELIVSAEARMFLPWMKRLQSALQSLPEAFTCQCDLFRGVKFKYPNFKDHFIIGEEIVTYTFKSYTLYKHVMDDSAFAGMSGERTIFIIRNGSGKCISPMSDYPEEGEVLLPIGTRLRIVEVHQGGKKGYSSGSAFETADVVEFVMQ